MKLKKHVKDFSKIFIGYISSKFMKLKKENRDIWLISERRDEAEDNGYHLYKYIRENYPEKKVYYIIDKTSKSYEKIKKYETVIHHNSLKHYIYYFLSDKHISAFQFFGVPEAPILWWLEKKRFIKKKKVFLQHGITKEMLPFLKYENTNYRNFICGAKPEYEYIKQYYGYPDENVKYLGFCRFDNLHNNNEKNQILVMPTWRQWLGMTNEENDVLKDEAQFCESEYFKTYNSLINNSRLNKSLKEYNIKLIFYPHPEMQRFIKLFKVNSDNIKIVSRKNSNLQELLKTSKILITDYSSIAFDFAYMRKPLIYYQFDQEKYYGKHFEKGYFDCSRDGFGKVIKDEERLISEIETLINLKTDEKYIKRAKEFFSLYDKENCKRTYEAICDM
ncbi:MAG: CDP-glycerol glycerophosphotransferase family protein [Clostridium sp.]|uniref:CDP-glycerol glycerophosphotransferase family protein n=1 Tax=Clostridium sp. TaxID=1506 RepID=UPI003050977D